MVCIIWHHCSSGCVIVIWKPRLRILHSGALHALNARHFFCLRTRRRHIQEFWGGFCALIFPDLSLGFQFLATMNIQCALRSIWHSGWADYGNYALKDTWRILQHSLLLPLRAPVHILSAGVLMKSFNTPLARRANLVTFTVEFLFMKYPSISTEYLALRSWRLLRGRKCHWKQVYLNSSHIIAFQMFHPTSDTKPR